MEKITNSRIREEYIKVNHKSGATLLLYPMKGYSAAYALFATKYGSVDVTFKTKDDEDFVTVPEGIAHYLEHQLFENEDGNAFTLYAKTGADANAFTSFDKTAYLFKCTREFEENLRILLDFVQTPCFTDESVNKERGIIGQEIRMYEDDPDWRVFFNCFRAMYEKNPVRIDIAGTIDTIAQIDKELLFRCYHTFYNPNNMVLAIAGNFDVDKVIEICDELIKPVEDKQLEVIVPDEPVTVKQRKITEKLSCAVPLFNIGWKFPKMTAKESLRSFIVYNILMDMCLGKTSEFYTRMYEQGLINDTFNVCVELGRGFFTVMASGESQNPDLVFSEIEKELYRFKNEGLDGDSFITVRNKTYGELVSQFGNVASVATKLVDAFVNDLEIYDGIEITANLTLEDVKNALGSFNIENNSLSVIEPAE